MPNLTRRSILGGAAALPILAAPALANVRNHRMIDRAAWDRAKRAYDEASASHQRASDAWESAEKAVAAALPPHPLKNVAVQRLDGSTHVVQWLDPDRLRFAVPDPVQRERLARRAAAFGRLRARLKARHGEDEKYERCISLAQPMHERKDELYRVPAPDVGALAFKLELLERHAWTDDDELEEVLALIRADALRLAEKGVQHG